MMPPAAQAQQLFQTGVLDKSTADKILVYPGERRTGIAFHMTTCSNPNAVSIETRANDFDLASYQVINNTQVGNHQGTGDSHRAVGRVNYLEVAPNRTDLADGVHTVSIKRCAAAPVDYLVTLVVWHDQGENSDRPASRHVQGIAASEDTGVVIHRSRPSCRFTDVRLATGAPAWLELRKHRANGTADGVGGRRFTVRMEKDHADDRHVRVRFKDDAEPPAGMHAFTVVIARTLSTGAGCANTSASTYTLSYTLNVFAAAAWEQQGRQSSNVVSGLSASDLGGSLATEMGPRIHHSSSLCRWTDVKLAGGGSFLGLQLHNSTGAVGAATTSFSDVLMRRGAAGDHHIRVVYRASQAVPASTVTALVEIKPSARCASYVGVPGPHTLSFTATVAAAIASTETWIVKGFNQATPTGPFSAKAIADSRSFFEVHTGIYIGYRTTTCVNYHYSLLNHRDKFVLYQHFNGRNEYSEESDDETDYSFGFYGFPSNNDNEGGFGLRFQAGASVTPSSTVTLHMMLSKWRGSIACGDPAPITLSYRLTISPAAPWGTLANNVAAATALFPPADLKAATSATDTGLRFNYGVAMSVCANVDVELPGGNSRYVELQKYNGAVADGAAASRFTNLPMHAGATGRPVGLQFKAGTDVPAGTLTVQVVARPNSSCNHALTPVPLTVKYELLVSDRQLWQIHARDSLGRVLALSPPATDTGVVAHRSLSGCEAMDVSLADDAPAWARLQQYGPSGPVGSPARVQAAVPMKGTGADDDRHVRLVVARGATMSGMRLTIGIKVAANAAACGTGSDIPAAQKTDSVIKLGTAWRILSGDNATATALFLPASLRAATAATDTGLRFHRGTAVCPQVDVAVRPTAFLELRKYNGNTADGVAAPSFANVRMQAGHADDRLVGVQFKAGVRLPASLFTATVVAKAVPGCTDINAPSPLTLAYELAVLDAWPWRAAAQDNFATPALIDTLELQRSGARSTGLRLQRNSRACSSTDVALASDAPAFLSLRRYSANGPDGAAARSLSGVNMSGSGTNDRHAQIAIAGGTALEAGTTIAVSLTVSANSSCSGAVGVPAAQGLVGYVIIGGGGLDTEAAMQAGAALAVRALGIETLGAIMARPGAASDASASAQLLGMLAAKEQELESGEIDLRTFLAGQRFSLPLSSSASGLPSGLMLWGRAAAYEVGSESEDGAQVESDLFSGSFGVDYRFTEGMLLGLGYGRHGQKGQYRNGGSAGSYQLDLNLYQPYAAARIGPGWLVAYGSQGTGNLLLEAQGNLSYKPHLKADYVGWGLGWYNDIERWDLRLRAGASSGELEFEEDRFEMNAEAGTARLAVAYAPGRNLVVDIPMQPEFEVAWADEWGDAAGTASWLVALVFDYAGTGPMHLRAAYRHAVSGGGDLAGVELDLRVDPNRGGLGPSFALRPHYGIEAGADLFTQAARPTAFTTGEDRGRRLQAEMAWGLAVSGGVLTPYGDWSMDNASTQRRQLGLRLGTGAYGDWNLGWRSEASAADELHLELRIGE